MTRIIRWLPWLCVALLFSATSENAQAGVRGNTYEPLIISSTDGLLDDCWKFLADGTWKLNRGLEGEYDELDLTFLSFWGGRYDDNGTTIEYEGLSLLQVVILATGRSEDGTTFVAVGLQGDCEPTPAPEAGPPIERFAVRHSP